MKTYRELLDGVDVVLHLANRARIDPSWYDYGDYYNTNITSTQLFFEAAQRAGVKKFIHVSSSSVYGNNGKLKQKESDPLMPTNPYAVSKMAGEWALHVQSLKADTELIIVRPFTMYGDYMDDSRDALVIQKFISAWEKDLPLLLHGGGDQRRDFIHVYDAIRGLMMILEHGENGDVYNLGTGRSVSIKQLADVISHKQVKVPARPGAVAITEADITRMNEIGFEPMVDVIEWLTKIMQELKLKKTIEKESQ
jgi:nucleoside-diphosphate-sugar epimerase